MPLGIYSVCPFVTDMTGWRTFKKTKPKWYSCHGKQCGGPSVIKNRITIWSNHFTSGYTCKRTEGRVLRRYLHIHVPSSSIDRAQEVKAARVHCWMNDKKWSVCTMEYYSALKRDGILTHDTAWVMRTLCSVNKPVTKGQTLYIPRGI